MARLTFPIVRAGLVVDVMINLEASVLVPLRSSGGGPSPVPGRGLIDTGSDISAVGWPILQQLGIPVLRSTSTQGIGASLAVNLYEVSLHILDAQNVGLPWLSHPSLVVMELASVVPFDALIGMDIIQTCTMLVDGPGHQFMLDF
ncbi:MAG: hypothetical protein K2R98_05860 [Gemmataceae bacterium]|nr:hypothetical protein [Gemmataceae bacterium]